MAGKPFFILKLDGLLATIPIPAIITFIRTLFNIENLVLWNRPEFNGFASKHV